MRKIYIAVPVPKYPNKGNNSRESLEHSESDDDDWSDDATESFIFYQGNVHKIQLPKKLCTSRQFFGMDLEEQIEQLLTNISFRCSHILVKHVDSDVPSSWRKSEITITRKDAFRKMKRVRHLIRTGELNFFEAARCISDCCSARHNGDLNVFRLGQILPEFQLVLLSLKVNNISRIFETQAGFHMVLRTSLDQEVHERLGRRSEIVTINERARARKHMKNKHVRFNLNIKHKRRDLCRYSDEYFERCQRALKKQKRHRKPKKTKEEERKFNLKMYEEQQRRIEACIVSKTPIDEKLRKELFIDEPLEVETSEEPPEDFKPTILKSVGNAIDLLRTDTLSSQNNYIVIPEHFLARPKKKRKKTRIVGISPFEFNRDEQETETWQPPDLYKNVHCMWKTTTPLKFTSENS
ncbi:uncharacterized protein [Drosophila tropicalis]|uniref:uncharacterized protein n=1 Tax=Drosophila tropicalis TaxID=46794 RepID=UPI0035AB9FD4